MKLNYEIVSLCEQMDELQKRLDVLDENVKPQYAVFNDLYKKLNASLKVTNDKLNEIFFYLYKKEGEMLIDTGKRFHETLPFATGIIRLCQLGGIFLLYRLDVLLTRLNIPYFIDYGNLLGYIRTGGTIPWDDDMDVDILIEDVIKVAEGIKRYDDYKDFDIICDKMGRIRFAAVGYPLFIDLIIGVKVNSLDEYKVNKTLFSRLTIKKDKESLLDIYNNGINDGLSFAKSIYAELLKEYIHIEKEGDEPLYVRSCLINMTSAAPTPIKHLFPLKRGMYDGVEVNIPNDPEFLLLKYGNYWHLPNDVTHRHSSSKNVKKIIAFCGLIKNNDESFYINRIEPLLNLMEEN